MDARDLMQFTVCDNTGFFLRLGLVGPSGSGKTYTALRIATELGYERVGVLDTENRSARRYARRFSKRFSCLEMARFSPRDYCSAIRAAYSEGIEVLVIDSLSHAWMGKGGVLEMVDESAKRQGRGGSGSSFNGWREVTPEHNRLVQELVQVPMHLIVTMRVKTEYVVEKDQGGKAVPRKVGLAPVQREGLEYEFDIVGDLSAEHDLVITKSRCPEVTDAVINRPGEELAKTLRTWLDGTAPEPAAPPQELSVERDPEPPKASLADRLRARLLECSSRTQASAVLNEFVAALKATSPPLRRDVLHAHEADGARLLTERLRELEDPLAAAAALAKSGRLKTQPGGERGDD